MTTNFFIPPRKQLGFAPQKPRKNRPRGRQFLFQFYNGAGEENRTPVSTLGRSHNGRYTTPARLI